MAKEHLKSDWDEINKLKDKEELAALYWFNHNLSCGPGFLGWMSSMYEDEKRVDRLIEKVFDFRCRFLFVEQGSFEDTIPCHQREFPYCDPPYYLNGSSKMFREIYPQRNFPVYHNGFDYEKLRDLLHQHQGGFVLSYNDCGTIRNWYDGYRIVAVEWQHTMGQGEARIGKNRIEQGTGHVKDSHELLIVGEV